jgi:hypothetical protein
LRAPPLLRFGYPVLSVTGRSLVVGDMDVVIDDDHIRHAWAPKQTVRA